MIFFNQSAINNSKITGIKHIEMQRENTDNES